MPSVWTQSTLCRLSVKRSRFGMHAACLMWFARLSCLYVSYACISGLIVTCISVMSLYKYTFICRFSSKCTDLFENGALCIVCFYWPVESVKSTCEITSRCISIIQVLQSDLISLEIWNQNVSCCHLAENRKVLVIITFVLLDYWTLYAVQAQMINESSRSSSFKQVTSQYCKIILSETKNLFIIIFS